jgi:hypothetical protein
MVWVGLAKAQLNADSEAVAWLRRGLDANRNFPAAHFVLAAALARLGELDQARAAVKAGLALDPPFTTRRYRSVTSAWSDNPTFLAGCERQGDKTRLEDLALLCSNCLASADIEVGRVGAIVFGVEPSWTPEALPEIG